MDDKNSQFLTLKKCARFKNVDKIIRRANKIVVDMDIKKILLKNRYEKIVPFNLWFDDSCYTIVPHYENNQYVRIRYYNNNMLTPLVDMSNNSLNYINKIVPDLSLYQPYYPETFFAFWELLQTGYIDPRCTSFLYMGCENRLGTLEAIIFHREKYCTQYQNNSYDAWVVEEYMFDIFDNCHTTKLDCNYLDQAYRIKFLTSTKQFSKYDFITIDCIQQFQSYFRWESEEYDLHHTLYSVITALRFLNKNGSLIVRLNMVSRKSWMIIIKIVETYFEQYTFYRPTILNPFNSEIYMCLSMFKNNYVETCYFKILKKLHQYDSSKFFYLNHKNYSNNSLSDKYKDQVTKWTDDLAKIVENIDQNQNSNGTKCVEEWHKSYCLYQIKDILHTYLLDEPSEHIFTKIHFNHNNKKSALTIKTCSDDTLCENRYYIKIVAKRSELNCYKRVMDTKPNQLFLDNGRYSQNGTLLNWETLSSRIDVYKNLKPVIKKTYKVEMLSNAWTKMYEILNSFDYLIPESDTVKTFHLCEAPGAFISATHHFITSRGKKLEWYAQTLKPNNFNSDSKDALDDYFGLISMYPEQWLFGNETDNSGDITHSAVIKSYMSNPKLQKLDFITADAGLRCDPCDLNEQERYLGKINMGQILSILGCLSVGKSAIFKTFLPMCEPLTISLIYLVVNLFDKVYFVKPATSHSTNSEVYVILENYKGIEDTQLQLLLQMLEDPGITPKSVLFDSIDDKFMKQYCNMVELLVEKQIRSLKRAFYYYYNYDKTYQINSISNSYVNKWLNQNKILPTNKFLSHK